MADAGLTVDWPAPGRYVLAVSGGADSMVLLDVFARTAAEHGYQLTVAHFDHGLRTGSAADAQFVAAAAARHGLPFEYHEASLGRASEATARAARHSWLEQVRGQAGAAAILTAHHQDDLIETSLLNLSRGSGRLGLAPMRPRPTLLRPFLQVPRTALRAYAHQHDVAWREDPTNADVTNPRNLLRHRLLAKATPHWRTAYLEQVENLAGLNTKIAQSISLMLATARIDDSTYSWDKSSLARLEDPVVEELIVAAARDLRPGLALDRPLVVIAARFARTAESGKRRPLRLNLELYATANHIILTTKAP